MKYLACLLGYGEKESVLMKPRQNCELWDIVVYMNLE